MSSTRMEIQWEDLRKEIGLTEETEKELREGIGLKALIKMLKNWSGPYIPLSHDVPAYHIQI